MDKKDDFKYDPEDKDENAAKYRLPFALCKERGIPIQDWWTPRDAWNALNGVGVDPDEEYEKYFREQKKAYQRAYNKKKQEREKERRKQKSDPRHVPDESFEEGKLANVEKGKPMTHEEADSGAVNPFYKKGYIGYSTNCQTCVAAYIARRHGYNISALPNLDNKNIYMLSCNTSLAYKDTKTGEPPKKMLLPKGRRSQALDKALQEGNIYGLEWAWKGRKSGHIVIAEKVGGEVKLYDPQTNDSYTGDKVEWFLSATKNIKYTDLTNVEINTGFCNSIFKGVK